MHRAGLALLVLAGLAVVAGCSPKRTLAPNLPPETTVFVQGPVDTVSYRVRLYWFGSDPDGQVVAYELRFLNPDAPADSQWIRTTVTDSLFSVYTPGGVTQPLFEVRAIDAEGTVDPTPARQAFTFRNLPPTLVIASGPTSRDTTFAAATFTWRATDPDGDIANATYRVWMDGTEANPLVTTATTWSIPTDYFRQGGQLLTGTRKLYVQAIDEGGYATPPESLSWFVRAPVTGSEARLLIVDDVPGNTGPAGRNDTLFTNTAARNLPAGTWSILRLEFNQPFRSTSDLEQTLKLFDAVIWYRGTQGGVQPVLNSYREGLGRYLESGGSFLIEGQQLVAGQGSGGTFPESWVSQYFGSEFLWKHPTAVVGDSSVAWGLLASDDQGRPIILRSKVVTGGGTFMDSLGVTIGGYGELRGFAVRDTAYVTAWARAGNLSQGNPIDVPVGVSVPQKSGGRLVAFTFPIRSLDGFSNVPRYLARIFDQLGLIGPGPAPRLSSAFRR